MARHGADVGAVEVGADAPAELLDRLLGETGVGTGGAARLAFEAGVNAGGEDVEVTGGGGVGGEDAGGDPRERGAGKGVSQRRLPSGSS